MENLFSQLRGLGGTYVNPTPAELFNRLRILLLGASSKFAVDNAPVQMVPEEDAQMVDVQAHGDEPHSQGPETAGGEEEEDYEDDGAEMITAEMAMASVDTPAEAHAMVGDRLAGASDPLLLDEIRDELEQDDFIGQPVNQSPFSAEVVDEFVEERDIDDEGGAATVDPEEYRRKMAAECNEQAHQYICGWLSYEFAKTHPELGTPTGRMVNREQIQPWLERVSRGGLRNPDQGFVQQVRLWDAEFDRYHGGPFNISYEKNVIANFVRVLEGKFP